MKKLSPLNQIILLVVSLHLLIVVFCSIGFSTHSEKPAPIIVRSIVTTPNIQKVSAAPKQKQKKPTPKAEKKLVSQPKPTSTTKSVEKSSTKPIQQAKYPPIKKPSKPHSQETDSLFIPTLKEPIKPIEPTAVKEETISFDQILLYLESMIVLPIKGAIKVKLRINEHNLIDLVEVLESSQKENERYLVETLNLFELPLEQKFPQPTEIIVTFRGF